MLHIGCMTFKFVDKIQRKRSMVILISIVSVLVFIVCIVIHYSLLPLSFPQKSPSRQVRQRKTESMIVPGTKSKVIPSPYLAPPSPGPSLSWPLPRPLPLPAPLFLLCHCFSCLKCLFCFVGMINEHLYSLSN